MALIELIEEQAVKVPLESFDKEGVIRELVDVLASTGKVSDVETLYKAVRLRETLGSTGLADGIAVPHGKTNAVRDLALAIGIAPAGIDFEAADGKPSKLFFLMAAPPDKAGPHIEALAEIARLSRSKALCSALVSAQNAADVVALLRGD
ncbi:MAG: PTS sugar transporter subunit IIA [Spirochaetales bacterium]|nr:MAG: PTS sugar transporter subunit IIA [Spirochaetales bacterium]